MTYRNLVSTLIGLLCLAFHFDSQAQVVVPNFSIIGTRGESSIRLLEMAKAGVYPSQVSLDISTNGVIYGFVCEYEGKQETFENLKAQIQKTMEGSPRIAQTNMVVWRNEQRKFSVQLTYMSLPSEEDEKVVRVIGVSIDKAVRNNSR